MDRYVDIYCSLVHKVNTRNMQKVTLRLKLKTTLCMWALIISEKHKITEWNKGRKTGSGRKRQGYVVNERQSWTFWPLGSTPESEKRGKRRMRDDLPTSQSHPTHLLFVVIIFVLLFCLWPVRKWATANDFSCVMMNIRLCNCVCK